jgi:hypothetical protein
VKGVTFKNDNGTKRQSILRALMKYQSNQVSLHLQRELDNPYDTNAIKIIASVDYKGSAQVGYVSKEIAEEMARLIDLGRIVIVFFEGITGEEPSYLGLNYSYILL